MPLNRNDWNILRRGIVPLGVRVAFSLLIVGGTYYFAYENEQASKKQELQLRQARAQKLDVEEAVQIYEQYLPKFYAYQQRGVLGKEERIEWISKVRGAADAANVPKAQYQLEPRQLFQTEFLTFDGSFAVTATPMVLTIKMVHEGDYFAVLGDILHDDGGLFHIKSCDIRRLGNHLSYQPGDANFESECTLNWLTVDYTGEAEAEML